MAIFRDGKFPPIDELLSERAVLDLLYLLTVDTGFLTLGQAHEFLRPSAPPGIATVEFHKLVRSLLDQLKRAGYLESDAVSRLPPVTIGDEPVLSATIVWYRESPPPTDEDFERFADLARRRVPPLGLHNPARLYFATANALEHLRSLNHDRAWEVDPGRWGVHAERARKVCELHKLIERRLNVSQYEIAGTQLTASYNVNQLRISERFRLKLHGAENFFNKFPEPPSDAGEPMGAKNADRPAMLGKRFRLTLASGMAAGLIVALVGHELLVHTWNSRNANGWGWLLAAIGGLAVGGALTLFSYGVSTDRTDSGPNKPHGQADVTTQGELSRTQDRRRRRIRRRRDPRV